MGNTIKSLMAGSDAGFMELFPLPSGESVAFHGDVIDIIGGQYLIDSSLVNTLHGYECVGKDLLHMPAIGIKFQVACAGYAAFSYMINVQSIGYCLYASGVERDHGGEEVVFGTMQTVYEAQTTLLKEGPSIGSLPDTYEVYRGSLQPMVVEVVPACMQCVVCSV